MPEENFDNSIEDTEEEKNIGEDEGEAPKISLPEVVIVVGLSLLGELLDIIDFGWLVGFPIQIWLIMKGGIAFRKQAPALVGNLIELIPVIDWLPIRTSTLLVTIYMINHPEIAEKVAPIK